jgi:hypothetical protein
MKLRNTVMFLMVPLYVFVKAVELWRGDKEEMPRPAVAS